MQARPPQIWKAVRDTRCRETHRTIFCCQNMARQVWKGIICQNCAKAWRHNRVLSANTILSRTLRCLKPRYQRRRQTQAARFEPMVLAQTAPFESQCRGKARGGCRRHKSKRRVPVIVCSFSDAPALMIPVPFEAQRCPMPQGKPSNT